VEDDVIKRVTGGLILLMSVFVLAGWQESSVEEDMITEIDALTAAFAEDACTSISSKLEKFKFDKMKTLMGKLREKGQARTPPPTIKPSVDLLERRMQEANAKCKSDDAYIAALKKVGEGLSGL